MPVDAVVERVETDDQVVVTLVDTVRRVVRGKDNHNVGKGASVRKRIGCYSAADWIQSARQKESVA